MTTRIQRTFTFKPVEPKPLPANKRIDVLSEAFAPIEDVVDIDVNVNPGFITVTNAAGMICRIPYTDEALDVVVVARPDKEP